VRRVRRTAAGGHGRAQGQCFASVCCCSGCEPRTRVAHKPSLGLGPLAPALYMLLVLLAVCHECSVSVVWSAVICHRRLSYPILVDCV
jgi:hypothetical protein